MVDIAVAEKSEGSGPAGQDDAHDWAGAMKKLKVGALALGARGRSLVYVGGRQLREGDVAAVEHDGLVFRWRIERIERAGVTWTRLDARPAR